MDPGDLIRIAAHLANGAVGARRGRPRQTELKRAVSAAYYAMFHTLAVCCANQIAGATRSGRTELTWRQVYRALEHGYARAQCERSSSIGAFPREIRAFAEQFVHMQSQRQSADYDPAATFLRFDVKKHVEETALTIAQFNAVSNMQKRAFAVYVLLRSR